MSSKGYTSSQMLLSYNGSLVRDEFKKVVKISEHVDPPASVKSFLKDRRLNMRIMEPSYDINMYHNYIGAISELVKEDWLGDPNKMGRWVDILNMGYIPILMAPSFVSKIDEVTSTVISAVKDKLGYKLYRYPPYRFDGSRMESANMDVYLSKIEVHNKLGIPYDSMSSQDLLIQLAQKAF